MLWMAPTKSTFSWHCTHTHTNLPFFTIETTLLHPICDVMYVTSRKKVSKVYFIGLSYFYSSLYTFISRLKDEFGIFLQLLNRYSRRHFFSKNSNLIGLWQQVNFPTSWLPTYKSGFYCLFRQNYELKATLSMHFFGTPEMWSCTIKAIQYRLLVQIELLPRFSLSP